jgi:hypothetical protein
VKLLNLHSGAVLARAKQRGVPLASIEACIVERRGDRWIVDVDHPAYPKQHGVAADLSERRVSERPASPIVLGAIGPGTELAKLLKRFGIDSSPQCQCRSMARKMDAWGPDECSRPERIDEVLAVMRAEAAKRSLPFLDTIGRMLIRRAIANARRAV